MFHLQSLELLQWDYCQRIALPLDGAIIAVAGPNGSGKTTLLDGMRTLLGLECSGGRTYKTYARHANADSSWLRAVVDNRPHNRQAASRPFARNLLYADQVTLACRIDRNGGDWQRRYLMVDGDVPIETLVDTPQKDWLGVEHWRKRLEGAGLSRAIARVLALEQGETDRLCEYSPKELLRLVFDVFGDQEVLDRYEDATRHQQELAREVEAAQRELAHSESQLTGLANRVANFRQYQAKVQERERLATEVVPVLTWHEEHKDVAARLAELHRARIAQSKDKEERARNRSELLRLARERDAANELVRAKDVERNRARSALDQARDIERPVEETVKRADELQSLAAIEGDAAQLAERIKELEHRKDEMREAWSGSNSRRGILQAELDRLKEARRRPKPGDVDQFQRTLTRAGIAHHVMADIVEIVDDRWRSAAEGVLRSSRWIIVLQTPADETRAMALAQEARYRHYLVSDCAEVPKEVPPDSLLAVLRFSAPVPSWLLRQLTQIRRVESIEKGARLGVDWITDEAYWRDGRGGRSVWVDPSDHQFGAVALESRKRALAEQIAEIDVSLTSLAATIKDNRRQLEAAINAAKGQRAAEELARRSEEFEEARRQLPALRQARARAGELWARLDLEHQNAGRAQAELGNRYSSLQKHAADRDAAASRAEREWSERRAALTTRAALSKAAKRKFPVRWIQPDKLDSLYTQYQNATQARLRAEQVDKELEDGIWERDGTVEEKYRLMEATVASQRIQLADREASNAAAGVAVSNARGRYIDVLRSTVRRYRKNIAELGELAGVEVNAQLPHLENDDSVIRQAELKVGFNFDGKGQIGMNDGEASGGQQVIKSLILLVGLLKDDETSGGFVFIDEPFAHLDVRNIQLVGNFLKSTRAQYVLTTPITHNVEVFEPADVTLVTSKKPRDARWAPPIGVLQRRAPAA